MTDDADGGAADSFDYARAIASSRHDLAVQPLRDRDREDRLAVRKSMLQPNDPLALQRILGARDLQRVNFLERGLRAAKAVCRVRIRRRSGGPEDFGTGFLAAPGLLITNNHVLASADTAGHSLIEFDYEEDIDFVPRLARVFSLLPGDLFFTDAALDVTFVAVADFAHDGTPLSSFGHLPLIARSGKGIPGEWVSLIQHPRGAPKQIVLRESQIFQLPDHLQAAIGRAFIHYTSDTEPGSSGAPVLNDQFAVVAVHHKAVAAFDATGVPLNRDGEPWDESQGAEARKWIANEGVRISAIVAALKEAAPRDVEAAKTLFRLSRGDFSRIGPGLAPMRPEPEPIEADAAPLESSHFAAATGYDAQFLPLAIPLPTIVPPQDAQQSPLLDGSGVVLNYTHFSIVMNRERRLAFYTAVNIDGEAMGKPEAKGSWRLDPRIEARHQSDNNLYKDKPGEPRHLDRGHLVRRLDPCWGTDEDIERAVKDTYHYTNAAPQEHLYNDGVWGNLEDLILMRAAQNQRRMSVFSGPVLGPADRAYGHDRAFGPYLLPEAFWKIVVFVKPSGVLSATAFRLVQTHRIDPLFEFDFKGFNPFTPDEARTFQTTIERVETETGLRFGALKLHDPVAGLEATAQVRPILSERDLIL